MKIKIPLFKNEFELELDGKQPTTEQLLILNQVENKIDLQTMEDTLQKMFEFYVEGVKYVESVLPKLIELGGMTQEDYDALRMESPRIDSIEGFIEHLLPPFIIMVPDPESCTDGSFGLSMECSWDPEHGVGVWFENWKAIRVGFAETGYA